MTYHPNPRFAAQLDQRAARRTTRPTFESSKPEVVTIGPHTLYRGDCFDVLPGLDPVDAVVTDPPYGIGFAYRTCDDSPRDYPRLMTRLIPALTRITAGGPCFVWQSPLKADQWHEYFPDGYRIIAACKIFPPHPTKSRCLSWDPVIYWGNDRLDHHLPTNWVVTDLRPNDRYRRDNPVPCPKSVAQVRYFCDNLRGNVVCDPFMGSGTTGVACTLAGKRFVGIERDPVYFEYARRRIEQAYRQSTITATDNTIKGV